MASTDPTLSVGGGVTGPQLSRCRRPPDEAEQARRKEWAAEWSNVGKDWKRQHTDERV